MDDDAQLLAIWERALSQRGAARDLALLGEAPASLAARNLLALERHARLFGATVELLGQCATCETPVEFEIELPRCIALLPPLQAPAAQDAWYDCPDAGETVRFRLPTPEDLYAVEALDGAAAFADALLQRCLATATGLDAAQRDAVSRRMQALMPGASLDFALQCPQCGHHWQAPLQPVDMLWRVLRAHAERLLADVALLARRFSWSERDILALSRPRRAAYLQLAEA